MANRKPIVHVPSNAAPLQRLPSGDLIADDDVENLVDAISDIATNTAAIAQNVIDIDAIEADYVSAASTFTDDRILTADGSSRGAQSSIVALTDAGVLSGVTDFAGGVVVNETGADVDFRVEGDNVADVFVVDAGLDTILVHGAINITATASPQNVITLFNSTGTEIYSFRLTGADQFAFAPTAGSAGVVFLNSSGQIKHNFADAAVIFNETGEDTDLRVEGDTATNLLTTDAANDLVQVGTTSRATIAEFGPAGITLNDAGADSDFRLEGDTLTHMVYTDANAASENIALLATGVPNWQSMDRGIFIADATTIPAGNPSGGGFLYVESGALTWRGSSGTVTVLGAA